MCRCGRVYVADLALEALAFDVIDDQLVSKGCCHFTVCRRTCFVVHARVRERAARGKTTSAYIRIARQQTSARLILVTFRMKTLVRNDSLIARCDIAAYHTQASV